MSVKWVDDEAAEHVLELLGIEYNRSKIDRSTIDIKASRNNHAREHKLDIDHKDAIAQAMLKGGPIPAIVVRKTLKGFVIAGGNHRDAAIEQIGEAKADAYIVECTDSEFIVLCRLLNASHGKGIDRKVRIQQAADAVLLDLLSVRDAEAFFNVAKATINLQIQAIKADAKLSARMGGAPLGKIPAAVRVVLARVQADKVYKAAVDLVASSRMSSPDLVRVLRQTIDKPSEQEQMEFISSHVATARKAVFSPKKKRFLMALHSLESSVENVKAISELDIEEPELSEVRKECKTLANILKSL